MPLTHSNPTQPRRDRTGKNFLAHAPYNFIPLPVAMVRASALPEHDHYEAGRLTGRIECFLETKSPLYVRGMLSPEDFGKLGEKAADQLTPEEKEKRAHFFSSSTERIEKLPVPSIPGSTLRGMVRTLIEIIGAARMRWVGKEPTFTFRAVAASRDDPLREPYREIIGSFGRNVYAGYLVRRVERDGDVWYIQPALRPRQVGLPSDEAYLKIHEERIRGQDIPRLIRLDNPDYRPQIHRVRFDVDVRSGRQGTFAAVNRVEAQRGKKASAGLRYEGFLVTSGNMKESAKDNKSQRSPRKKHALVLMPDERARSLLIPQQVIDDYLAGLTDYQKEMLTDWSEDSRSDMGCLKDIKPVFYVAEGNTVVAFGHSPNFRIAARLERSGRAATPPDFVPDLLRNDPEPDLVDAMFGWVEDDNLPRGQRAGRLFFEDARFVSATDGVWLQPTPIIPHVLSSPKATTFQHYLVQDEHAGHNPDRKESLAHYGTSPKETQLRGYKLYWHRGATPPIEASAAEREHEKQLTRIVPVRPGVCFHFILHFENLRPEELGAIWWALTLPGKPNASYCHNLGMGKPLGMGAVALQPKLVLSERSANSGRYAHLFDGRDWHRSESEVDGTPFAMQFESYVLQALGLTGASSLLTVKRIQMLLEMLRWREGEQEWLELTSYMEVEAGAENVNEYKERPVLPDPLAVSASHIPKQSRVASQTRELQISQPPKPDPRQSQPTQAHFVATGLVKKWVDEKGYGFIIPDSGGKDIFVHISDVEGKQPLRDGKRVQFEIRQGPKGRQARSVRPI